jgi:hypothetical protein
MDTAANIDSLLWHFGHQLPSDRQGEFHRAAESALAHLSCVGPGSVYRALAELVPGYFIPPIADCDRHNGPRKHRRFSKLIDADPIGRER